MNHPCYPQVWRKNLRYFSFQRRPLLRTMKPDMLLWAGTSSMQTLYWRYLIILCLISNFRHAFAVCITFGYSQMTLKVVKLMLFYSPRCLLFPEVKVWVTPSICPRSSTSLPGSSCLTECAWCWEVGWLSRFSFAESPPELMMTSGKSHSLLMHR